MSTPFTHAIVLDFEATCDDQARPSPQEIIEFPSVLVSLDTLAVIDEFEAFVRPVHHPALSDFCRELTSIRQTDVDGAPVFPEVLRDHMAWLDKHGMDGTNAVMVTCGDWDLGTMLPAQCPVCDPPVEALAPIYTRWHNIKRSYCEVTGKAKAPGMAGMLRERDLTLVGRHHRGIDDCRNIAALLKDLINAGAEPEVTADLPLSKYPPVTIRLRLDDRIEETRLEARSISILYGLTGRLFHCRPREIHRADGRVIWEDGDLASLAPGETLELIASS